MENASIDLPQIAKFLFAAKGNASLAHTLAVNNRASPRTLNILSKAAVGGAFSTDGNFGEVLVDVAIAQSAFFGSLRNRSVFFRMLDQGFRRVPLRTHLGLVSASATAYVVGEGALKPLSRLTLSNPALTPKKVAAIIVTTDEVAADTSAAGQSLITQELRGAVADTTDEAFFAAMMPGMPSTPSSGAGSDAMAADLKVLLDSVNISAAGSLFWAMAVDVANRISLINDGKGAMSPLGGEFLNLPALVSSTIPAGTLRLINAAAVAANADAISLDVSNQTDLLMRNDPEGAAALTSMFQTNSVALKAEVSFAAEKTRDDAVAEIVGIEW